MFEPIKVDQEIVSKVENADYAYSTKKDVITMYLNNNFDVSATTFIKFKEDMEKAYGEFNKAKADVEKIYVLPVIGNKAVNWSLDYSTCEITITER